MAENLKEYSERLGTSESDTDSDELYRVLPGINQALANNTVKNDQGYLPTGTAEQVSDINSKFLNFRQYVQEDVLSTGYSYIFMTKPKLNLDPTTLIPDDAGNKARSNSTEFNTNENGFFKYIAEEYPEVMYNLTYLNKADNKDKDMETVNDTGNFIKIISNKMENFSGINDLVSSETTATETYKGYKIILPTTYTSSVAGGTLSIDFTESDPPLLIYMHKVWMDYIEKIKFGALDPTDVTIANKEIDYASSIYYFVLGPDGETIKFWAKFWNVIPKSLPLTAVTSAQGDRNLVKVQFQYNYSYAEYLDPATLIEFNDVMFGEDLEYNKESDVNFYMFWGLVKISKDGVRTAIPSYANLGSNISHAVNDLVYGNNESTPNKIPGFTTLTPKGIGMDTGEHDKAGVVKVGKNYKLVFFDN